MHLVAPRQHVLVALLLLLESSLQPGLFNPQDLVETMTNQSARAPLRLLLVTDGNTIPNWLFHCIQSVERSGAARIVLVLKTARQRIRGPLGFRQHLRQCFFWLYQRIDRHLFRASPDALAPINLASALAGCRVFQGADLRQAPLAGTLQEERIDVVLDPFSLIPDGRLADLSRYGVWSTPFGEDDDPRTQSTPAFWEVIHGRPSTETRLCIHQKGWDQKVSLYVSVAPTDRRSVSRSQNHVYWKISAALTRKIQMLWEDPDAFVERLKSSVRFELARSPAFRPGNLEMLRAGARLIRRYASDKWTDTLFREQWALAYRHGPGDPRVTGALHKLIPPKDRDWADPFPIQVGDHYYIFHEELVVSTGKGTIVVTVVDDNGNVAPPLPVLQRDYHLSYPFVFQWAGDFFMIPETASHHQVELYHCRSFPSRWKLERVLLSGLTAFDPTLAFLSGKWWLFASIPAYGAGSSDELHLFYADSPLGPWTPHRNNPMKSDVRSTRPAGRIFESHGHFYRPAQDGSKHYGYAVSINRILQLNPDTYEEVEVDRIVPNPDLQMAGVHTFNVAGNMTVIDWLVRRKKFWTDHLDTAPGRAGPSGWIARRRTAPGPGSSPDSPSKLRPQQGSLQDRDHRTTPTPLV